MFFAAAMPRISEGLRRSRKIPDVKIVHQRVAKTVCSIAQGMAAHTGICLEIFNQAGVDQHTIKMTGFRTIGAAEE
jgi:hypothetical protein